MPIERNVTPRPVAPPSDPVTVQTSNLNEAFTPPPGLMEEALGLHTVPSHPPELEFITQKIMDMGGNEGPTEFANLLMKTIREAEHSPFSSGDKMKDVFAFLKLRETAGSVLSGWE